jgi:hypothetical protein
MKLSQDLKPVSYFKNNMAAVIRKLNEHQGTMIITQNGEAKAALIDIKAKLQLRIWSIVCERPATAFQKVPNAGISPMNSQRSISLNTGRS